MFTPDGCLSYQQPISQLEHLVGKVFAQRIERHNLTLRTHIKRLARRTIGFSKSVEIPEKLIGAYRQISLPASVTHCRVLFSIANSQHEWRFG